MSSQKLDRDALVTLPKCSLPERYAALLGELKSRIVSGRLQAALAVNKHLNVLYWSIGRDILARQSEEGSRSITREPDITAVSQPYN